MSTINDTDQFLVQRDTTTYKQSAVNLMSTIQDTDLMLVQRGTESFKVTCEDVKDQLGGGGVRPISVSKGEITPSSNVQAGQTLTGSATVENNAEPTVYYHKWYVNGVHQQEAVSNTFVAVEGSITYQLCVTDPNNTEQVCGALSDAVAVAPATTPTATMHGLRFDPDRKTKLLNTSPVADVFTISFWFKYDGNQKAYTAIVTGDGNGVGNSVMVGYGSTPGEYYTYYSGLHTLGFAPTANVWEHVVVAFDGTNLTAYLNGEKKNTVTPGEYNIEGVALGYNAANDAEEMGGYLSDVYCVDGQALEPTAFGKFFEGKWGPLDGSVVLQNIGDKESPSDTLPNIDEKWSAGSVTGGFQNPVANLFDGDLSTGTWANSPAGFVLIFPNAIQVSNSITFIGGSNEENYLAIVDGVEYPFTFQDTATNGYQQEFTVNVSGSFTAIKSTNQNGELHGIKADRRLLVDGPANNSKVWSDYATGEPYTGGVKEHAFDGDLTTEAAPADGTTMTFIPDEQLEGQVTIIARGGDANVDPNLLTVNGIDYTITLNQQGASGTVYEFDVGQGNINTTQGITWSRAAQGGINFCHIYGIKVGGKLLVDGAPTWNTDRGLE